MKDQADTYRVRHKVYKSMSAPLLIFHIPIHVFYALVVLMALLFLLKWHIAVILISMGGLYMWLYRKTQENPIWDAIYYDLAQGYSQVQWLTKEIQE